MRSMQLNLVLKRIFSVTNHTATHLNSQKFSARRFAAGDKFPYVKLFAHIEGTYPYVKLNGRGTPPPPHHTTGPFYLRFQLVT